ncbi:MAG: hypothetical protein SOZ59_08560 [Candidatus Limivivens sp.]|nr:hypothetical protein [Candidatus Limivivens sp.]
MVDLDPQKKIRMAMNGRMTLMCAGLFLIFTAVTSTLMYGINLFMIAGEAAKGTAEYTEMLESAELSITLCRAIGICFIILTVAEIFSGICCVRFSNRIDKSRSTWKIIIALLAVEILMQVFLLLTRMLNPGMLFTALAVPLCALWGVTRFRKLAKDDPDRVYATEPQRNSVRKSSRSGKQAPTDKSLRERAMMDTSGSAYSVPKGTSDSPADVPEELSDSPADVPEEPSDSPAVDTEKASAPEHDSSEEEA